MTAYEYQYDAAENLELVTYADGSSESWVYGTDFNLPLEHTSIHGHTTYYRYHEQTGDLLVITHEVIESLDDEFNEEYDDPQLRDVKTSFT